MLGVGASSDLLIVLCPPALLLWQDADEQGELLQCTTYAAIL